jgi:hypothetical protein
VTVSIYAHVINDDADDGADSDGLAEVVALRR